MNELQIPMNPVEGQIELAIAGITIPRIAITELVKLTYGDIIIETELEVILELNSPPIFLGVNTINKLNIPLNGIPIKITIEDNLDTEEVDDYIPLVNSDNITDLTNEQISWAMSKIQPELSKNEQISPLEPCPLEMAIVRLDTPENQHTY